MSEARRRSLSAVAVSAVVTMLAMVGFTGAAAADTSIDVPTPGASVVTGPDYRPLDPARLADTRAGRPTTDGLFSGSGQISPASPLILTVGGRGGVPASDVVAVALNVTVTDTVNPGYVTVYPAGETRPTASNVNFDRRITTANSVIAKLNASGQVAIYGSVPANVIVDVSGYFVNNGIVAMAPTRLADTRATGTSVDGQFIRSGAVTPAKPLKLQVTGRGGIPSTATAVALTVVAVTPTSEGYLTVFPSGTARPVASNVNFRRGETISNSVTARIGSGGKVTIYNSSPAAHVVVDVVGYFTSSSGFRGANPARFADTRSNGTAVAGPPVSTKRNSARVGPIGTRVANEEQIDILISGRGSVPLTDTGAVILNVTVTQSSSAGYVTVFPMDSEPPTASSVNFEKGRSVANMVVAKLGRQGGISILTSAHGAHVVVDVLGYFPGVSTKGSPTTWTAFDRDPVKMPVTYDRCFPIPFVINQSGAPAGWVDDVWAALDSIGLIAGIDFEFWGFTGEAPSNNRNPFDPEIGFKPLLIAFTTAATIPDLGGDVVGLAGSVWFSAENAVNYFPRQYVTGEAYFDRQEPLPSGTGVGGFGQVAFHELAHVVGLGHVDNVNELMNPVMIDRSGTFGPGDLEGLGVLYKTQSCPGSPATYLSALKAGGVSNATATSKAAAADRVGLNPGGDRSVRTVGRGISERFDDHSSVDFGQTFEPIGLR